MPRAAVQRRKAWQQICTRHRMWLSTADQPQLDLTAYPETIAAQRRARPASTRAGTLPQACGCHRVGIAAPRVDRAPLRPGRARPAGTRACCRAAGTQATCRRRSVGRAATTLKVDPNNS